MSTYKDASAYLKSDIKILRGMVMAEKLLIETTGKSRPTARFTQEGDLHMALIRVGLGPKCSPTSDGLALRIKMWLGEHGFGKKRKR